MAKKKAKQMTAKRVQATENTPVLPTFTIKPEIDDEPWGEDGLTLKQRLFVQAYVGPAAGNATRAAEIAGYAAENRIALACTASENLRKPHVAEAIAHAFARQKMTPEWAKASLWEVASASMRNFLTVDENGDTYLDMAKASHAAAIGQIKEYYEDGLPAVGSGKPVIIKRRIKLYDRVPALVAILKMMGLIVEKHEHGGTGGGPVQHDHTISIDVRKLSDEQLTTLRGMVEDANRRTELTGNRN